MARMARITEELMWSSYKARFFIGERASEELKRDEDGHILLVDGHPVAVHVTKFVNDLQKAIDDGIVDKMVKKCADTMHGGDVQAVYYHMTRNLDSQRHTLKTTGYSVTPEADKIRLETMVNYINSKREAKIRLEGTKPQWAYGPEDIDQITDVAKLQKVINSINDVACGKGHSNYAARLGVDFLQVAKANREYARKRKAILEAKAEEIDPNLLAKLMKGKASISAAEAEALLTLLRK